MLVELSLHESTIIRSAVFANVLVSFAMWSVTFRLDQIEDASGTFGATLLLSFAGVISSVASRGSEGVTTSMVFPVRCFAVLPAALGFIAASALVAKFDHDLTQGILYAASFASLVALMLLLVNFVRVRSVRRARNRADVIN